MRRLALCGVILLLLTACTEEQSPLDVIESFMTAIEDLDLERAEGLVCAQQRARVRESIEPFGDVTRLSETFTIRFEDLSFHERSNDGSTAIVRVNGRLTLSFLGQQDTQPVDEEHLVIKEDGRWVICDP